MTDPATLIDHLEALLEDVEDGDPGVSNGARVAMRRARQAVEAALAEQALSEPGEILRAARQLKRSLLIGLPSRPTSPSGACAGGQSRILGGPAAPVSLPLPASPIAGSATPGQPGSERDQLHMIREASEMLTELEAITSERALSGGEQAALDRCRRSVHSCLGGSAAAGSSAAATAELMHRALRLALHDLMGAATLRTDGSVANPDVEIVDLSRSPDGIRAGTPSVAAPATPSDAPRDSVAAARDASRATSIPLLPAPKSAALPPPPTFRLPRPPDALIEAAFAPVEAKAAAVPTDDEETPAQLAKVAATSAADQVRPVESRSMGDSDGVDLLDLKPNRPASQVETASAATSVDVAVESGAVTAAEEGQSSGDERVGLVDSRRRAWLVALCAGRVAGVTLLLFVVYALFGTAVLEGRAQRSLSARSHLRITSVDIGMDALVMGTDSRSALANGPGSVPGSGDPGSDRPLVIVGNRTTNGGTFGHLTGLHSGAPVTLRTGDGHKFTYIVERNLVTSPHGTINEPGGTQVLLLVTATPAYHDSRRLVVVARLVGGASPAVPAQTIRLPGLRGSAVDLGGGLLVVGLLGLIWGLRSVRRPEPRRWLRWASWVPAIALAYLSWQLLLRSLSPLL